MDRADSRKRFWQLAFFPIVVYALVEGLRWGHLVDYNVYAVRYGFVDSWFTNVEHSSPMFTIIVYALKSIGVPYSMFIVLQCGFLMFSGIFLLQDYKTYAKWILPCFLIAFSANENFIRFFLGLSFFFIALYYLTKGNTVKYVLFSIVGCLIHFGVIPLIVFFMFSRILNKRSFPPIISCILFVVSTFAISISDLHIIVSVTDFLLKPFSNADYQFVTYANSMDRVIMGEGGAKLGVKTAQLSNQIKNLLTYVPVILLAPKWINRYEWGNFVYNVMIINIIISPIFTQVELMGRFTQALGIFCALGVAVTFSNYTKKTLIVENKCYLILFLSLFCYFYGFINSPFVRQDYEMYFIWDSNGAITNWAPYHRGAAW